ncbi:uncharacterized protein LOC144378832 isoform X1 [Halichoerus grypus]
MNLSDTCLRNHAKCHKFYTTELEVHRRNEQKALFSTPDLNQTQLTSTLHAVLQLITLLNSIRCPPVCKLQSARVERPFGLMQENTKLFRLKFIIFPSNNDQLLLPSMIRDSVKVPAPSHFDFEIKHRVSPMKWR